MFTPHARGSTASGWREYAIRKVYPACAGIDLNNSASVEKPPGLPRMRGDRPWLKAQRIPYGKFTPHARGSTWCSIRLRRPLLVYPACAGIDLGSDDRNLLQLSLPRMRGDRPFDKSLIPHF